MKSFLPQDPGDERKWVVVDAADKPLGRLATHLADLLRGKNEPTFSPSVDTGVFVVVINAEKVKLTGRKNEQKIYQQYTGFRGGLKETTAAEMREKKPEQLIMLAVRGMVPHNRLGRRVMTRLKVYAGPTHPHEAQKPEVLENV